MEGLDEALKVFEKFSWVFDLEYEDGNRFVGVIEP
jgi:hypothetical protein